MPDSPHIVDVTAETFQQLVVEQSRTVPVVIDFWAPWCRPCRDLGPILEALAVEYDGRFILAKVNTDENQELAGAFRINGIPAVFAIRDGKLADRFEGLLPEDEVRGFINRLVGDATPSPAQNALELEGRDPASAEATYRGILAEKPDDEGARVGLARLLLTRSDRDAEATEILAPIEVGEYAEEAARLRTIIRLREVPHTEADLAAARAAGETPEARLELGRVLAARGEYLPALDTLLAAAGDDRALAGTTIRELMVQIFTVIGPRSPEADDYRRKLQNLLY